MADTKGPLVNAVAIVFAVITFIVICLRFWARFLLVKSIGADDWLIVVAVFLAWAFIGCTIASVEHGLGSHYVDVAPRGTENMIAYSQIVWLSSIFYNACLGFIKVSALALYKRLGDKTLSRLSLIMIGVVTCQAGGNVLACIFQCTPVEAAYDITILPENKSCVDINAFYLANAAVNILTDILTYSLPIPLIFKLQMPVRQKIGLGVILSLGLFACISSIIRITYIPPMLSSDDQTYVIAGAMYWSVIETNIGILASSIPSFKVIASRYFPGLLGSSQKSSAKLSGFQMMDMHGNKDGSGLRSKTGNFGTETRIQRGYAGDSEEDLVESDGRIRVKTEIQHSQEEMSHNHQSDSRRVRM